MQNNDEFREFVKRAPVASAPTTVAVGKVTRADGNDESFVLTAASGSSVTLPLAAVKRYSEMVGPFGQTVVRLELELSQLPAEVTTTLQSQTLPFVLGGAHQVDPQTLAMMGASPSLRRIFTDPDADFVKPPRSDGTYPTPHGMTNDF